MPNAAAEALKTEGNALFKAGKFAPAVEKYKGIECNVESTLTVTATLTDASGSAVAAPDIDSIVCDYIETSTGDAINSRTAQSVLNANNCTMHATSGLFTWNVQTADTSIVNTSTQIGDFEHHLATFVVTWDTTSKLPFRVLLKVRNLRSVT